jgi:hypothetical protein
MNYIAVRVLLKLAPLTFNLRGVQDAPPDLRGGLLLPLADTVEFLSAFCSGQTIIPLIAPHGVNDSRRRVRP